MKKAKIFATIITLCLAISTLAYGVYAATNLSFTIGANIAFEVQNLFVDIEMTITGGYAEDLEGNLSTSPKTFTYTHNSSSPVDSETLQGLMNTWQLANLAGLQFNPDAITPITISVEVANYTPGKNVLVTITDNTAIQGGGQVSTYLTKTGTGVSPVINAYTTNPAPEGVATFTYTPLSLTNAFTANFGWTVNISSPVVVTLNANGGTGAPASMTYTGTAQSAPTAPTKEGFDFGGWYTDSNCTTGNEVNWANVPTANTTYYAKWSEEILYVTLTISAPNAPDWDNAQVQVVITGTRMTTINDNLDMSTRSEVYNIPDGTTVSISISATGIEGPPDGYVLLDGSTSISCSCVYGQIGNNSVTVTNYSLIMNANHTISIE